MKKSRTKKIWVWGVVVFAFFCFLKVWQSVHIDQMYRQNARLEQELTKLENENALLTARIEWLKREERIVAIARKRLGLVKAPKISLEVNHKK
ncbi:hypothetical protein GF407_04910 [candidate division KSB1 bacterium]|nr:hypothetical protein [candidate division KSB1 bacterium]